MIISASYRTDIPAFYGDWFRARLRAGFAEVRNPYGGGTYRVALDRAAVDGFIFWTRNAGPFRAVLDDLAAAATPFVVQFTVTGYPRPLDAAVVQPAKAVEEIRDIAQAYGARAAVWRYDPVIDTSLTPAGFHRRNFAALARELAGAVDEGTVSFAQIYRKTRRNLTAAAAAHGFTWTDPDLAEKRALVADLAATAKEHGMQLTVCAQPELVAGDAAPARCIDKARLSAVAGRPISARDRGNRPGCLCAESRDIGTYDTCPHGCVYCYAVSDRRRARANFKAHRPESDQL